MKKLLSLALASVMLLSAMASCGTAPETTVTLASSDAAVYADWLADKLGYAPEDVVLGIGSSAEYGIDMTDFENDGYVLRTVGDTTVAFGKTADGLDRAVREYAKAVAADTVADLDTVYHEGYRIKRLTIAGKDISEYTIYYPAEANENMKFAVNELIRLVKKACGAELTAVQGEAIGNAIEFCFSYDESLRYDGYKYTVSDNGILFEGAVDRGSMYAVWRFLQNECGWDFLIYGDSYLNPAEHVDVPAGTVATETPAFDMVNLYNPYAYYKNDRATPTAVQNSYGPITHACHGLQNNRFCLEKHEISNFLEQPCFTSEEVYELCRDNVEAYVAARYGTPGFKEVDIAQYDTGDYCLCETCFEVYMEEGGNAGAVVRFANRLQEELDEKYPGIVYKIFAYAGTNVPPKVSVPNELVYVTFCYDMNCSNHKADGSECGNAIDKISVNGRTNEDYAQWFEGWCDLTPNVYIWPYTLGTALNSYTVIDNIYDDYRYYAENEVRGIMLETEDYGGFSIKRIEHQLIAELNWNMDMTRDEFHALYLHLLEKEYGDGWECISEYVDMWNKSQDLAGCWQCWGWSIPGGWETRYNAGFLRARFDDIVELFEDALAKASSKAEEDTINRLYASALYKGCYSSYYFEYLEGNEDRINLLSDRYTKCMDIVRSLGYDPAMLPTIGGGDFSVKYAPTLYEAAWKDWRNNFTMVTGLPLPEDAPVMEP